MNISRYITCIFAALVQKVGLAKGRAVAIVLTPTEKLALAALTQKHRVPQALAEKMIGLFKTKVIRRRGP